MTKISLRRYRVSPIVTNAPGERLLQKIWLPMNEGIERALDIIIFWCASKMGTRQKSQVRLKSDLDLQLFGKKK